MTTTQDILRKKIEEQEALLERWRKPSETLLFETLRSIDYEHCRELLFPDSTASVDETLRQYLMSWGVNGALKRVSPTFLGSGPFHLFPSNAQTQQQADEFIFQCGILDRVVLLLGWLDEGLVSASIDRLRKPTPAGIETVIVLESQNPSTFSEVISRNHLRWLSDFTVEADKPWEERLGEDFKRLEPELESCVSVHGGWGIAYSATPEIDEFFLQVGQTYLRRMWSQDLIGLEERIGGYQFNEYLGVLAALSGRAQKHLCFSTILKRREPRLNYRNLLTTYCPCEVLIISLAGFLDADTKMIRDLLGSLTLEPSNLSAHTDTSDTAWAPVVRSSADFYILPLYGLETNPFLFLLNDLRHRYPDDWFRAANNREARWQLDIEAAFPGNQWNVRSQNLRLRDNGNTLTDIDFLVYDREHNQVGLIQLKWQQPIGVDNRARRSAGKNLVKQGNDWIDRVMRWLAKNGTDELLKRAGIEGMRDAAPTLFVIARYNACYSGFFDQDGRATWADWGHFLKARIENPRTPLASLALKIREETARLSAEYPGESYFLPLGDTAVVVNPSKKPTTR